MKKLLFYLLLACFSLPAFAQEDRAEIKKQINKIKKSQAYVSAEATMPTEAEAMEMANQLLVFEINNWLQSKRKSEEVQQVVLQDISSCKETLDMKRGTQVRAFVYVKKDDIIPSDNATVIDNRKQDEGGQRLVTVVGSTPKPAVRTAQDEALDEILRLQAFSQLKTCLTTLKQQGKISDYDKYSNIKTPSGYYLIIYNRQGMIEAVLGPGTDNRKNLKTNAVDNISNYKGRGAIGFKF